MKVYVFLKRRAIDSQPWPLVFESRTLAENEPDRVSDVAEVELTLNQRSLPLDPP